MPTRFLWTPDAAAGRLLLPDRRIWTQQPPYPTELDSSNPLTHGLRYLSVPFGNRMRDVFNFLGYTVGTVTRNVNKAGREISTTGSSSYYEHNGVLDFTEVSFLSVFRFVPSGNSIAPLAHYYSASGYGIQIQGAGRIQIVVGTTSGWEILEIDYPVAGMNTVAASISAIKKTRKGVLDDGKVYESTTTGSLQNSNFVSGGWKFSVAGSSAYGHTMAGGGVNLAAVWNRALSAGELAEVARNPWQLFQPEKQARIFIGGAASTVAPTLSLPGVSSITQTGATPYVTLTF